MNNMINYYNQNEVIQIFKKHGIKKMTRVTFWNYEKKGYIKRSGQMKNGSTHKPIYTDKEVNDFMELLPKLRKQGKVRI